MHLPNLPCRFVFLLSLLFSFSLIGCDAESPSRGKNANPPENTTANKLDSYRKGMTLEEIEANFGYPAKSLFSYPLHAKSMKYGEHKNWVSGEMLYRCEGKYVLLKLDDTRRVNEIIISDFPLYPGRSDK